MGDYFKPWRRKFGFLTLMLASVFMAGWVRSLIIGDCFLFKSGQSRTMWFFSSRGSLFWASHEGFIFEGGTGEKMLMFGTSDLHHSFFDESYVHWHSHWCGFGFGDSRGGLKHTLWVIPYWSLGLPLTALAAYLLISKPRQLNQKQIIIPTANDGA